MLLYFMICKAVDMTPQPIRCLWSGDNKQLLHCYVNDFVSFSGIGIELGNLSGHRTLITFCKLIANYMYITHTFS